MKRSLMLLWSIFFLIIGPAAACQDYLIEKEGKKMLKETLTMKEEQGGIAGISVTEWKIEPSGKWMQAEFLVKQGKEVSETRREKTGTLTQQQMTELAKALAAQELAGLPTKIGGPVAPVNPHRYTLTFGPKTQAMLLDAVPRRSDNRKENILDGATAADDPKGKDRIRFANIVDAFQTALRPKE